MAALSANQVGIGEQVRLEILYSATALTTPDRGHPALTVTGGAELEHGGGNGLWETLSNSSARSRLEADFIGLGRFAHVPVTRRRAKS